MDLVMAITIDANSELQHQSISDLWGWVL